MMDYTVIGSKVNLASRITSFAPRNTIIVDRQTKNKADDFHYRELNLGEVKGYRKNLKVYKVISN